MTRREQILTALAAALGTAGNPVPRNDADLTRLPPGGLVILHDGDPGQPDVTLSPLEYHYTHRAELDVMVIDDDATSVFDAVVTEIGIRLAADRTLGGLCDWIEAEAPAPSDVPVEGSQPIRAASIGVVLFYSTPDPLG
ncbi:MAG: acyl-CoA transferase [Paracoccaceae bacterium]